MASATPPSSLPQIHSETEMEKENEGYSHEASSAASSTAADPITGGSGEKENEDYSRDASSAASSTAAISITNSSGEKENEGYSPDVFSATSYTAADPITRSSGDYSYDVFINHRGPDTKKNFAGYLYRRLLGHGLKPFLDQQELQEGVNFPSQIVGAIRNASVHVAIFSPTYAASQWCLDELLLMQESRAPIIPVFYKVKPADLRWTDQNKTGVYAKALDKLQMKKTVDSQTHEEKPRYDSATIQNWRNALSSVADISGYDLDGKFDG